jgi:hypothetical protein
MLAEGTRKANWFRILLATTLTVAVLGWGAPWVRMPLDVHNMLWISLPLAGVWLLMVAASFVRLKLKALWLLAGAPLAFYWPIWLLVNGIPPCYWMGNCV